MPKTFGHFELSVALRGDDQNLRVLETLKQQREAERRARALAEQRPADAILVHRVWPATRMLVYRAAWNESARRVLASDLWISLPNTTETKNGNRKKGKA